MSLPNEDIYLALTNKETEAWGTTSFVLTAGTQRNQGAHPQACCEDEIKQRI